MRVSPLVAAICLAAGIAAGSLPLWVVVMVLAAGCIAICAWRPRLGPRWLLAPALVAFGLFRATAPPPSPPPGTVPDDRDADEVTGSVSGPVVTGPRGYGALVGGDVWVWSETPLVPGQRVVATGIVRTPRGFLDPGSPDRAQAAASRGASWEMSARTVEVLDDGPGPIDLAWRWAAAAQARWSSAIVGDIEASAGGPDSDLWPETEVRSPESPSPSRAALAGVAMGARGDVPPELDARWRTVGIYHVLSVSGLHLAVVAGLAFSLLRRLFAASPLGARTRPARWAAVPALAIAVAYTMVTGAQLATVRALVVIALVLAGRALDRPLRLVDALGAAAVLVLAWRPIDLHDPSFQLSFVAALVLARIPHDDDPLAPRPTRLARVLRWARRGIASSIWVSIATAPITAYHFHQIQPGGIVGNLVLTPVVELVSLPLALAGVAIGELVPVAGDALVSVAAALLHAVDVVAGLLAHAVPVATVGVASASTMAALAGLALYLAGRTRRGWRDLAAWTLTLVLWASARSPAPPGSLRITFLDVGQGDAAIVELPDGHTWLVDAGGLAGSRDLASGAAPGRAIDGTLAVYGRSHVDLAVLSHPHPDHYLGLAGMTTTVDEVWTAAEREPDPDAPPTELDHIVAAIGAAHTHPPLGLARAEAGAELVVWAPRPAADPLRSVNDNSLVVAIRFAGRTVLFTGDIERDGEDALVAAGIPRADVVKVPHHGSPTSSSPALVDATRPSLAVISCGAANRFKFPSPAVVARWRAAGADIARTDTDGAVTVTIDEAGQIRVSRFRE